MAEINTSDHGIKVVVQPGPEIVVSEEEYNIQPQIDPNATINVVIGGSGAPGKPGKGVPDRGLDGQVLIKNGTEDYSTYWGSTVHFGTTEYWNSQPNLVGLAGHLYVYTDYMIVDNENVPAMKIGDGTAFLIDNPFIASGASADLNDHINNTIVHITGAERAFWNAKMRGYVVDAEETAVFTVH